ncbi:DUF1819 family protein [Clostridium perfringens]
MNSKKYSAKLTGESFLLYEFKIVAKLKKEGFSDKEIRKRVLEENLFQYKFKSSISRRLTPLIQRINFLDDNLINRLIEDPLGDGIIINLYAIMKNDRLFFEFMNEVMKNKLNENNEILEKKDINIFIETKIEQNNDVAEWSEATISKIKQVIRKILIEAGIIEDIKNGKIHKVKMSNWLKQYLIDKSEEKYVLALGETI